MSESASISLAKPSLASASVFVATFAGIVMAIAVLLALDLFLARLDRRASAAHAATEYAAGVALLRDGRAGDAAERLGIAVAIDRANVSYGLALSEATLTQGRIADAESMLRALLDRAENDGAVNLAMAHVLLREGRAQEAAAYFHRAIFGRWGADSIAQRTEARFELIDLLARRRAARELLAELLPLEDAPPDSIALRLRLGRLFILAGSPARAANMFREVLRRAPENAAAYAGMGAAALALGHFQTARADLDAAARLEPGDAEIAARLALADTVLALDPTAAGIGRSERDQRSRALLTRTLAIVSGCGTANAALADSARAVLSRQSRMRGLDAADREMMSLATALWSSARCPGAARDDVTVLIYARLGQ